MCFLLFLFAAVPSVSFGDSDLIDLYLKVGDTTITQSDDSVVVSVFLETFADSVGGIELWLFITNDWVFRFRADSIYRCDTTYIGCADSACTAYIGDSCISWEYFNCADTNVDCHWVPQGTTILSGGLLQNWDMVTSSVLDANHRQLKIVGIANESSGQSHAIPPNSSNTLLCRLIADVRPENLDTLTGALPDSLCPDSSHGFLGITPITVWRSVSRFSNTDDALIGWVWEYRCIDSVCVQWEGSECVDWDCTAWDYTDSSGHVDTNKVKLYDGVIDLDCATCNWAGGDANGAGDPPVDIDDIVYLINYVFGGGPQPVPELAAGDANCSGGDPRVDIDDIVYLINFVFGGGPAPCPCEELPPL
jgi:hypothetical protein